MESPSTLPTAPTTPPEPPKPAVGLLPLRTGSVRFKGQDVTRLPAHQRARLGIGYAPEDCGLFPDSPSKTLHG